jgi:hypothetical protein
MEARATLHAAFEASGGGDDESPGLAPDPLRRLEAELGAPDSERPDDTRQHAETRNLLEEAWSLFTECLVMRDGLLEACQEIERTMQCIQRQLGALPVAIGPGGQERLANGMPTAANGKRPAASSSNAAAAH